MFASDKGRINRASRGAPSERVKKGEG